MILKSDRSCFADIATCPFQTEKGGENEGLKHQLNSSSSILFEPMLQLLVILFCICFLLQLSESFRTLFHQNFRGFRLNDHSVGIDLGTTYSLVSIIEGSRAKLLKVDGSFTMPSAVHYTSNSVLVGKEALEKLAVDPINTFTSVKRLIGRSMEEAKKTKDDKLFGKKLVPITDEMEGERTKVCGLFSTSRNRIFKPEEISQHIIRKLLQTASNYLQGEKITRAVITVPAYFTTWQGKMTEKAGKLAGLETIKLLKEPEAAAMAYGFLKNQAQFVLVIDLGGGTLDVSVLEVGDGLIEVIATSGDGHLGGDDFDQIIVEWILQQLQTYLLAYSPNNHPASRSSSISSSSSSSNTLSLSHSSHSKSSSHSDYSSTPTNSKNMIQQTILQLRENISFIQSIQTIAQQTKLQLTTAAKVNVTIINPTTIGAKELTWEISRGKFESLSANLLARILMPIRKAALMAGINLPGESGYLLGDTYSDNDNHENSHMKKFSNNIQQEETIVLSTEGENTSGLDVNYKQLKRQQTQQKKQANAQTKVMKRATMELKRLQKENSDSRLSLFPSGKALDDVILVGGASRMPCIVRTVQTITGIDPKRTVNPDEAICLGAGIFAGVLDGKIEGFEVLSSMQAAILRLIAEETAKGNPMFTQPQEQSLLTTPQQSEQKSSKSSESAEQQPKIAKGKLRLTDRLRARKSM
jgi:molecular chaperone DnaK (HSP70)